MSSSLYHVESFSRQCTDSICGMSGSVLLACGLWSTWASVVVAPGLSACGVGSVVVMHGLRCSAACRILVPQPGIKPVSSALQGRFFTTGPPGTSLFFSLINVRWICFWVNNYGPFYQLAMFLFFLFCYFKWYLSKHTYTYVFAHLLVLEEVIERMWLLVDSWPGTRQLEAPPLPPVCPPFP